MDAWAPGARIGDYLLGERLGAGGAGSVYRAQHLPTGAWRALKRTPRPSEEERERSRREAEALARVRHPHVLGVHERFAWEGDVVLATELAEGDLGARLREGPLPPAEAAALVAALGRGLAAAHEAGVLHRDLKPANVLFLAGRPLLGDFGLARLADRASLTASGALLGTPSYMAPELALGERGDARTDVYGLGAILYACLTAAPPFVGPTALATMEAVLSAPTPRPSARASVPPGLERVCLRALAKDPAARYPDVTALVADLEDPATLQAGGASPLGALGLGALLAVSAGLALALTLGAAREPAPEPPAPEPTATATAPPPPPEPTPSETPDRPSPRPSPRQAATLEVGETWTLACWRGEDRIVGMGSTGALREWRLGAGGPPLLVPGSDRDLPVDPPTRIDRPQVVILAALGDDLVLGGPGRFLTRVPAAGAPEVLAPPRKPHVAAWRARDGALVLLDGDGLWVVDPRAWQVLERRRLPNLHARPMAAVVLSDDRVLACYGAPGGGGRMHGVQGQLVEIPAAADQAPRAVEGLKVRTLAVIEGEVLAGGESGFVGLVDLRALLAGKDRRFVDREVESPLTGPRAHRSTVRALAVLPGRRLASLCDDGALNLWSLETHALLRRLLSEIGAHSLAPSPDGRHLLVGTSSGRVLVVPVPEGGT